MAYLLVAWHLMNDVTTVFHLGFKPPNKNVVRRSWLANYLVRASLVFMGIVNFVSVLCTWGGL